MRILPSALLFAALAGRADSQDGNKVKIEFEGTRQVTFSRSFELAMQPGHVLGRSYYANDNYSLEWDSESVDGNVYCAGCESAQGSIVTNYIRGGTCEGKPFYESSIGNYLYYFESVDLVG